MAPSGAIHVIRSPEIPHVFEKMFTLLMAKIFTVAA